MAPSRISKSMRAAATSERGRNPGAIAQQSETDDGAGRAPRRASFVRGGCYDHRMCEACTELDGRLEAVTKLAAPLPSRLPRVRDPVLGRWMAQQLDTLLLNVAAGRSACDVAVAEGLDTLDVGR